MMIIELPTSENLEMFGKKKGTVNKQGTSVDKEGDWIADFPYLQVIGCYCAFIKTGR